MMDILMSETCWAHKKWNKIASDIKLVFHSSTNITELLTESSNLQEENSSISTEPPSKYCRFKQVNGQFTVRSEH